MQAASVLISLRPDAVKCFLKQTIMMTKLKNWCALGWLTVCVAACQTEKVLPYNDFRNEVTSEIKNDVLPFWLNFSAAPDGGFYGTVMRDGTPDNQAPRGSVLNARILWSFSAAYRLYNDTVYLNKANDAQAYFLKTFVDRKNGGLYWLVRPDGSALNASKYAFALTYGIYGLVEHYRATGNRESLNEAIALYHALEDKLRDPVYDGYLEWTDETWHRQKNYDNDAPKTMNTHLHVMEAYTELYRVWNDETLKKRLAYCVGLCMDTIYDASRKHLRLYFDDQWHSLAETDSYGHDVETGWLLCEAARALGDQDLIARAEQIAVDLTRTCLAEGLDPKGYMAGEKKEGRRSTHASWWGQTETLIACVNA